MRRIPLQILFSILIILITGISCNSYKPSTVISIRGNKFYINDIPTYNGRTWNGNTIEGLLFNSRMVQGIFDDINPETVDLWKYPDTDSWDSNRNTNEFVKSMEDWYRSGMLSFTLNLQGGSPTGYGNEGWVNSAFNEDGSLKKRDFTRLYRILKKADQLGMTPILGLFYFGQDEVLKDEEASDKAVVVADNLCFGSRYTADLVDEQGDPIEALAKRYL